MLLILFVHIPATTAEYKSIEYLVNSTEVIHRLDAQDEGCFIVYFTIVYDRDFASFLRISTMIDRSPKLWPIFGQFPNSINEYQHMIKNLNNITKEKWGSDYDNYDPPPFIFTYNFTTAFLTMDIKTYRRGWFYTRDFTAYYASTTCLIRRGYDKYQELIVVIRSKLAIDICVFSGIVAVTIMSGIYNVVVYWRDNI